MGIKKKVMGLIAVAAISSSLLGGSVYADTSHLGANENPNGTCTVSVTNETISYGTWEYNGSGYTRISEQPTLAFNVAQSYVPSNTTVGCDVNVTGSALTNITNPGYTVGVDDLTITGISGEGALLTTGYTRWVGKIVTDGEGAYVFHLGVNGTYQSSRSIPAVGTYEGTITLTTSRHIAP